MKCPKCQFENPPDAQFCNDCGSKLELICPECGKANPTGSKFCNECGGNLRERKPGPQVDFAKPKSYTPKFLAEKILTSRSSIEGERKIVTVLFADVAGFASMSEQLDPEEFTRSLHLPFPTTSPALLFDAKYPLTGKNSPPILYLKSKEV